MSEITQSQGERARQELPEINGILLSGKYGPGLQPVYDVRHSFVEAGLDVAFPRGAKPIETYGGYTFSTDEEQYVPFPHMQQRFFELIEENPNHFVVPGKFSEGLTAPGYIGFSTSHEIAYALLLSKPIVITSDIEQLSPLVPDDLREMVEANRSQFIIEDPLSLSSDALRKFLAKLPTEHTYEISPEQSKAIKFRKDILLQTELHRWLSWALRTERDFFEEKRPDWINERQVLTLVPPMLYGEESGLAEDDDAQMYLDRTLHGAHIGHSVISAYWPDMLDFMSGYSKSEQVELFAKLAIE